MNLLPSGGQAPATKADLVILRSELIAAFHQEMNRQIWMMIGSMIALSAVLTANNIW